ncbi:MULTISPECIES: benzoate/H(+) symporter BenE family transporter [Caldimonas]|uniref:benzoate/H(+) symporter BenE family transporter n=1 Tax=Caldimonas TaxID=196013 RepID=UPI000362ADCE|nr:benzoate/H(+) symporter BenE family transporter [Caldimonas manganoxidans]GIX23920.1 MAG: benzoate transporter [Caldimonas sp.]
MRVLQDGSLSAAVAGFVAVLVGFTSSVALVFQAASALGATPAQTTSWIWALGLGTGLTSIALSLRYRQPVLTAWSTPGAAVLAASAGAGGLGMAEATGAFIACGVLITLSGLSGLFERAMNRIPAAMASALLAGVLARFGMEAFLALQSQFGLVLAMFLVYLLGRRCWPRYAVPGVLAVGLIGAWMLGELHGSAVQWSLAWPVWTTPQFTLEGFIGVALPLFVVTMASQNLPGVAAIRAAGYHTPVSPLITWTGLATLVLAPFGAYALNLAAITAALCMSPEAHADPQRRYMASVMAGVFYLGVACVAGAVVGLLAAVPRELVWALAGLALLGTIGAGLATAVKDESHREAALVTFLVTLSGVTLWGVGSAFWGVVAGTLALMVQHYRTGVPRS